MGEVVKFRRLKAAEIVSLNDVKVEEVFVPDWNGSVFIRSLTAGEAVEFAEGMKKNDKDASVKLLMMSAVEVDDEGKIIGQLFTKEHLESLRKKSLRAVLVVQNAAMELNGLNDKAKEAAKNG